MFVHRKTGTQGRHMDFSVDPLGGQCQADQQGVSLWRAGGERVHRGLAEGAVGIRGLKGKWVHGSLLGCVGGLGQVLNGDPTHGVRVAPGCMGG